MADWTPTSVEARLHEAADVMKRLPEVRVQGYYSLWPKVLAEFSDQVGQEPPRLKRPPPSPDAISRSWARTASRSPSSPAGSTAPRAWKELIRWPSS